MKIVIFLMSKKRKEIIENLKYIFKSLTYSEDQK